MMGKKFKDLPKKSFLAKYLETGERHSSRMAAASNNDD
jgi:hypothetical protein